MALLQIKDLSFTYPGEPKHALSGVDLTVEAGQLVVLCGPSGCGKTTLLRHLKPDLAPSGEGRGTILFGGIPVRELDAHTAACRIGLVQQDPENQIVMEHVLQELAFGLENIGLPQGDMRRRIAELAHAFGIEDWLYRKTHELSGGQKQLVNLAAVLLMQPDLVLLDEPTAQLDPVAAKHLLQTVRRLGEEFGMAVIMTEHRLEELFPLADKIVMMDEGTIRYEGTPHDVVRRAGSPPDPVFFPYLPSLSRLYLTARSLLPASAMQQEGAARNGGDVPLTVKEGRDWFAWADERLNRAAAAERVPAPDEEVRVSEQTSEPLHAPSFKPSSSERSLPGQPSSPAAASDLAVHSRGFAVDPIALPGKELQRLGGEAARWSFRSGSGERQDRVSHPLLECRDILVQYERSAPPVLKQVDLRMNEGDFLCIVGGNGAGKSTLLQVMAGLLAPRRGSVRLRGKELRAVKDAERHQTIGYLSQNPLAYFMHDTIGDELRHAASRGCADEAEAVRRMGSLSELLGLSGLLERHPHDASGGERQKAALACVLLAGPRLLLLDEPTKGLDPLAKRAWGELLQTLHREGHSIALVTHDVEFAARYASRCAMLFDGAIVSEGAPHSFFADHVYYTTTVSRVVRGRYPDALTYEDVLGKWNVKRSYL